MLHRQQGGYILTVEAGRSLLLSADDRTESTLQTELMEIQDRWRHAHHRLDKRRRELHGLLKVSQRLQLELGFHIISFALLGLFLSKTRQKNVLILLRYFSVSPLSTFSILCFGSYTHWHGKLGEFVYFSIIQESTEYSYYRTSCTRFVRPHLSKVCVEVKSCASTVPQSEGCRRASEPLMSPLGCTFRTLKPGHHMNYATLHLNSREDVKDGGGRSTLTSFAR